MLYPSLVNTGYNSPIKREWMIQCKTSSILTLKQSVNVEIVPMGKIIPKLPV